MAQGKIKREDIQALLRRSEFWVGAVTVVVFLMLVARLHPISKMQEYMAKHTPAVATKLNLQPTSGPVSPAPQAQAMQKDQSNAGKLTHIKMLADTSGEVKVVVLQNDNFWNISRRVCGTGRYYLSIQAANGYQNGGLQPGDTVVVTCSE